MNMDIEWNPAEDGLANCMRRAAKRPIGDLIRETDPDTFKDIPRTESPVGTISDEDLYACIVESRNIGNPRYFENKARRIAARRSKTFTDQQMNKGAEILARIEQNRKTA